MTKEKLKWIIKRLPYILKMLQEGVEQISVYISKRKEKIAIDEDVKTVIEIMDEIIDHERIEWRKKFFMQIRKGHKDIAIIFDCPMERTKYYLAKKEFIDKIYQCCIYRGLVDYEDILNAQAE